MAKLTLLLKTRHKSKDGTCPIIIRLRSGLQVREIPIGFKVKESQWNGLVIKHEDKDLINAKIADKISEIKRYFNDCILNDKRIDLNAIGRPVVSAYFTDYLTARVKAYKATGQAGQAGRIEFIINELNDQFGKLAFADITADILRAYHAYLLKGHKANTIHKRFAILRQLFTNAVNEGLYVGANPFIQFKVKTEPVRKEKLTLKEITQIEKAKVFGPVATARDIFLLSYYCKGIRFENCLFLQWKDIRQGRIYIRTNKGNKHISILIHPKLKTLLGKYKGKGFVFPYVDDIPDDKRKVVDIFNVIVNRNLKVVAAAAGIEKNLSMHLARHSIALHLKQQGVNIGAIRDILGHSETSTTEIYLQSLDDTILDKEMRKVYK